MVKAKKTKKAAKKTVKKAVKAVKRASKKVVAKSKAKDTSVVKKEPKKSATSIDSSGGAVSVRPVEDAAEGSTSKSVVMRGNTPTLVDDNGDI